MIVTILAISAHKKKKKIFKCFKIELEKKDENSITKASSVQGMGRVDTVINQMKF